MTSKTALTKQVLLKILRPLSHILLRNGITARSAYAVLKEAYVSAAGSYFSLDGKISDSRIATLTGLSRVEVARIRHKSTTDRVTSNNRASAIISAWTASTLPEVISFEQFRALVAKHSGGIPPHAILNELIRAGTVQRQGKEHIQRLQYSYTPFLDDEEMMRVVGDTVAELLETSAFNLSSPSLSRYQQSVYIDNIPDELVEEFKAQCVREAESAHENIRNWARDAVDRYRNQPQTGTLAAAGSEPTKCASRRPPRRISLGIYLADNGEMAEPPSRPRKDQA